jgi:hypothetical protein
VRVYGLAWKPRGPSFRTRRRLRRPSPLVVFAARHRARLRTNLTASIVVVVAAAERNTIAKSTNANSTLSANSPLTAAAVTPKPAHKTITVAALARADPVNLSARRAIITPATTGKISFTFASSSLYWLFRLPARVPGAPIRPYLDHHLLLVRLHRDPVYRKGTAGPITEQE